MRIGRALVLHNIRPEQNSFFLGNYEKNIQTSKSCTEEACVNRGIGHGDWTITVLDASMHSDFCAVATSPSQPDIDKKGDLISFLKNHQT